MLLYVHKHFLKKESFIKQNKRLTIRKIFNLITPWYEKKRK